MAGNGRGELTIRQVIEKHGKKTIDTVDILRQYHGAYEVAAEKILQLNEEGVLSPVRSAGLNGRRPLLHNRYRILEQQEDYRDALRQIRLLHSRFDHQYYLDHPKHYLAGKAEIDAFSDFLWTRSEELQQLMSINERSFSVFGKEKLLKSIEHQFSSYFRMQGFSFEDLGVYLTPEPFFEYIHPDLAVGEVLIIENKDTWYTIRKLMKEEQLKKLFGIPFKVLIYGEGKKITRQAGRLEEYQEEVLKEEMQTFYYFGDLDYEGISIFQEAKEKNPGVDIRLLTGAYEAMLRARCVGPYPRTRDNRKPRADLDSFLSHFNEKDQDKITEILASGSYIPQEILNCQALRSEMEGDGHV